MTTYTVITNGEIDQDSPVTQALMTAVRDNPIAITEGASGAPRIEFAALNTWYTTAGGIGTYVFAKRGTGTADVALGATLAGSSLVPTSAMVNDVSGTPANSTLASGSALSGTWQCMGNYDYETPELYRGGTLWVRIA